MEIKIKKIQTSIFTRNFNVTDDSGRARLLLDISEHSKAIFDAPPVQFPIPSDAPPEIPRIILNSADHRFNCSVSLSRADIFFNISDNSKQSLEDLLQIQKNNSENIFSFLIGRNIIVNRIGCVVTVEERLSPEEGDSCNYLKSNFIRDGKFINPKELVFRYNQVSNSENFEMNNLITINGRADNKIMIQTDINTSVDLMNSANFNVDNFNEIFDYAARKTQELIGNFPNL
jgi:hypothetical protein